MKKTKSKFEKIVKILCAMLLAAIQIVGYSFSKQNNWNLVIKDGRISGKAIVIWAIGSIYIFDIGPYDGYKRYQRRWQDYI